MINCKFTNLQIESLFKPSKAENISYVEEKYNFWPNKNYSQIK